MGDALLHKERHPFSFLCRMKEYPKLLEVFLCFTLCLECV